jgi:hypothetical protein
MKIDDIRRGFMAQVLQPAAAPEIPGEIGLDDPGICWHKRHRVFSLLRFELPIFSYSARLDAAQDRRWKQGGATMSLFDIRLKRSPRFFGTPTAARSAATAQPQVEVLEERQCPSVAAPTGLELTALSSTQVKLTWTNPAGALGSRIYTWNGTSSVFLAQVGKGIATYTASNLTPNATQWFAVEAYDSSTTAMGAWDAIMTPAEAITVPTNVHIGNTTQTSISLAWTNGAGATGYNVYQWNGTSAVLVGNTTPSVPAFTVNGLTSGVTYYFYVQAYNADNSVSTSWISASTTAESVAAVTNLKTSVLGPSTIALSWKNAVGTAGYKVYQWNGNSANAPILIATLPANTTGYQAVGLVPGQTYWFYVQAFSATAGVNSAWVSATTTAAAPLQPPTQLTVQPDGASSAILSWTDATRADGYRILVWTGAGWSPVAVVPAGTDRYVVTGLTAGQTNWLMIESFTTNYAETAFSSVVFVNL